MEFIAEIASLNDLAIVARQFVENVIKTTNAKCFAFFGEMGAGKTTFIKAICDELQVIDWVNSPSFAIINEYHTAADEVLYHFDFYRINKIEEVYDLGYEDYFYSGRYCFFEWAEKIEDLLPDDCLHIEIKLNDDNSRTVRKI